MPSKDIVAGVGTRYGQVILNDTTTGLPSGTFNSGTLQAGTNVEGIKSFTYNDPDTQKITHYGNDYSFAQDSLPATEVGSFNITTGKTNLALDTVVDGTTEVTLDSSLKARAGNTNKKGNEPFVTFSVFRQALDTQIGSSTFGRLRQWNLALIPSTRIVSKLPGMAQGLADKTYQGIPTPVRNTPWNIAMTDAIWNATQAEYFEMTADYQPVIVVGQGNGTLTRFGLPVVPVDTAHCHVWGNGTLQTVVLVGTSATAPYVQISGTLTGSAPIFAIIETTTTLV